MSSCTLPPEAASTIDAVVALLQETETMDSISAEFTKALGRKYGPNHLMVSSKLASTLGTSVQRSAGTGGAAAPSKLVTEILGAVVTLDCLEDASLIETKAVWGFLKGRQFESAGVEVSTASMDEAVLIVRLEEIDRYDADPVLFMSVEISAKRKIDMPDEWEVSMVEDGVSLLLN